MINCPVLPIPDVASGEPSTNEHTGTTGACTHARGIVAGTSCESTSEHYTQSPLRPPFKTMKVAGGPRKLR